MTSPAPVKVLVVEDEEGMRHLIRVYLERDGYQVLEAASGEEARSLLEAGDVNLVLLDLMLPGQDGWSVVRQLRERGSIPIIILTARGDEADRIQGFDLGADDYVVKPFSPGELMGRVRALLRRSGQLSENVLVFPRLSLDLPGHSARVEGREVDLTPREFQLLSLLARHPGRAFSREDLLRHIWGPDYFGDERTVDTHINNLREKLGRSGAGAAIRTVWGLGYKFQPEAVDRRE